MRSYLNNLPLIYIPLLMLSFIAGSALLDLLVVISAISWIIIYRKEFLNLHNVIKNIFIFLFIFYFLILLSSFFSEYLSYSLSKSFVFIRFILFGLFFYQLFSKNIDKLPKYINGILIVIFFLYFDTLLQLFVGKDIFGFVPVSIGRLSGPFGDELILGSFLFIFTSIYSLAIKNYDWKYFTFIFFSLIIISLTGERIALIKFTFFHILLTLFLFSKNKITINLKQFLIILSFLIIIMSIFFKSNMMNRHVEFVNKFVPGNKNFILYSGHYAHYVSSLEIFKDNPIIGTGYRSFRKDCKNYDEYFNLENVYLINSTNIPDTEKREIINSLNKNICSTHPHNFYLEILSEIGILGFVLFTILLAYIFRKLNYTDLRLFFLVYFFPLVSTNSIFHGKNSFLFIFIIVLLNLINQYRISHSNEKY